MPKVVAKKKSSLKNSPMDSDLEYASSQDFHKTGNGSSIRHMKKNIKKKSDLPDKKGGGDFISDADCEIGDVLKKYSSLIQSKNKNTQTIIKDTIEQNQTQMANMFNSQDINRKKAHQFLISNMTLIMEKFEADQNKMQENEAKLQKVLAAQARAAHQAAAAHALHGQALRDLCQAYNEQNTKIDENIQKHRENMDAQFRQKMQVLQEHLLGNSHKERMEKIKKNILNSMELEF